MKKTTLFLGILLSIPLACAKMSQRSATPASVDTGGNKFIIGGSPNSSGDAIASHTVLLYGANSQGQATFICSATLLNSGAALTAAHCINNNFGYSQLRLFFGTNAANSGNSSLIRIVTAAYAHPAYVFSSTATPNDIGVVLFGGGLPSGYSPVSLSVASQVSLETPPTASVFYAGYGLTNPQNASSYGVLYSAPVQGSFAFNLINHQINVYPNNGTDICSGDSGGPMFAFYPNGAMAQVGVNADSNCSNFAIETDVRAFIPWIQSITPVSTYAYTPPGTIPAASSIRAFVRGSDYALYEFISSYVGLGGYLTSDTVPVKGNDNVIYDFARGGDGALYYRTQQRAWAGLGGYIIGNPAPVLGSDGQIYVFVRGGDNALYYITLQNQGSGYYPNGGYQYRGGGITSDPVAIAGPSGLQYVFVRGSDGALYYWTGNSTTNNGYIGLGGYLIGNPGAVLGSDGKIYAFVQGGDNGLWFLSLSLNAAFPPTSSGYQTAGGKLTSDPIPVADPMTGLIDVFARGTDGALYLWSGNGSINNGYIALGGYLIGNPSAIVGADQVVYAFVRGGDNALYYHALNTTPGSYGYLGGVITGNPRLAVGP